MFELKTWLIGVVAVCFSGFLIRGILPAGKVSESVVTVLRLVILCVLLFPLFKADFTDFESDIFFDKDITYPVTDENNDDNILLGQTEIMIQDGLRDIVGLYYDGEYEIIADMDILSDNSIHIKQILVVLYEESENKDVLLKALQEFCPLCEITFSEELKSDEE